MPTVHLYRRLLGRHQMSRLPLTLASTSCTSTNTTPPGLVSEQLQNSQPLQFGHAVLERLTPFSSSFFMVCFSSVAFGHRWVSHGGSRSRLHCIGMAFFTLYTPFPYNHTHHPGLFRKASSFFSPDNTCFCGIEFKIEFLTFFDFDFFEEEFDEE
jgi:hypothetical protein